jgi:glycosidase
MFETTGQTPVSVTGKEVESTILNVKTAALENATRLGGPVEGLSPFPSPADWRDRWIYFLMVDRFNNPNAQPAANDPYLPYQGGNFEGIFQQLDYIKGLGAGAIWLSPVMMNPQAFTDYYGGYATSDFLRIEPRFCRDVQAAKQNPELADQEFRGLVDAIHARGMYVVLDIVLNHVGDLFNYEGKRDTIPWRDYPYNVYWRDKDNIAHGDWMTIEGVPNLNRLAGVWPKELQHNDYFRRQGDVEGSPDHTKGDFGRLKELKTELQDSSGLYPVRNTLIRAYQYLIAKFDVDAFRVDTLMYVQQEFARTFANAMREFALSIGKKNFFCFGEVCLDDNEERIAEYIGRDTTRDQKIVGFDAALDFPLRKRLENVCKGVSAPRDLANHMAYRQNVQRRILSSHGDASSYFVTFLDNHDLQHRFAAGCRSEQVTMALSCLYTMQGIPCLYYGTEQGLNRSGSNREYVRECLWRDPSVFNRDPQHDYYRLLSALSALRDRHPALRYGRQYFRELTGNDTDFGYSEYCGGILAFSRILNDAELLIVANTNQSETVPVHVVVDRHLNPTGRQMNLLFSNLSVGSAHSPAPVHEASGRSVVPVRLRPMEVQILGSAEHLDVQDPRHS